MVNVSPPCMPSSSPFAPGVIVSDAERTQPARNSFFHPCSKPCGSFACVATDRGRQRRPF